MGWVPRGVGGPSSPRLAIKVLAVLSGYCSLFCGYPLKYRNRQMWEITRSRKVELGRLICQYEACYIVQGIVKAWPEMFEGSSRYDPAKGTLWCEKIFWTCPGGGPGGVTPLPSTPPHHIRGGHR